MYTYHATLFINSKLTLLTPGASPFLVLLNIKPQVFIMWKTFYLIGLINICQVSKPFKIKVYILYYLKNNIWHLILYILNRNTVNIINFNMFYNS